MILRHKTNETKMKVIDIKPDDSASFIWVTYVDVDGSIRTGRFNNGTLFQVDTMIEKRNEIAEKIFIGLAANPQGMRPEILAADAFRFADCFIQELREKRNQQIPRKDENLQR